jgi:hypothetical protein
MALTVGVTGTVYLGGYTYSATFLTASPLQRLLGGGEDGLTAPLEATRQRCHTFRLAAVHPSNCRVSPLQCGQT